DLELGLLRRFSLAPIEEQCYTNISMPDEVIYEPFANIADERFPDEIVPMYRHMMAKNLQYMELIDAARPDWKLIEDFVPQKVQIDPSSIEGCDSLLKDMAAEILHPQRQIDP